MNKFLDTRVQVSDPHGYEIEILERKQSRAGNKSSGLGMTKADLRAKPLWLERIQQGAISFCLTAALPSLFQGFTVLSFDGSIWPRSDSDLGITGFIIEDFEDTNLAPGLQIQLSDSTLNFGPTNTLPLIFDPVADDPNAAILFASGVWDGSGIFLNRANAIPLGYLDFGWGDTTFFIDTGATSFGFSLQNMELTAELQINGSFFGILNNFLTTSGGRARKRRG